MLPIKASTKFLIVSASLIVLLQPGPLWASKFPCDVGRLTMGRTTDPEKALIFHVFEVYTAKDWADSTQDTLLGVYEVEYGITDRLTLESIVVTKNQSRDDFEPDRLLLRSIYRVLDEPFQWAPYLDILPSLHGDPVSAQYGFKTLKNIDVFTFLFTHKAIVSKATDESDYQYDVHEFETGWYYRFGLRGLTGGSWKYESSGDQALTYFLGGSIGQNLFIGVDNSFGIAKEEPDYSIALQMTLYFGSSAVGGFGLE